MTNLKRKLGFLALVCLATGCGATLGDGGRPYHTNRFVGTWKGFDKLGQTMVFTLKPDGRLTVDTTGLNRRFTRTGTYAIDPSSDPYGFNFKLQGGREIRTICKLIDDKHLAFENISSSDWRPQQFGKRRIVLIRQ
ncbi:MAG: hypothetical protein ACE5KM_17520 [Planctomycetaceae bacterium]